MNHIQIGQRIRDARKQQKLTQEALAELANISASYLSHVERGTKAASLTTIVKIAVALEISLDQLLFDTPDVHTDAILPDIQSLLENATPQERCFLCQTVKAVRQYLREYHLV